MATVSGTFAKLRDYEKSLPRLENVELGLLDYGSISPYNTRLLNKIFLSLLDNPLVYESFPEERFRNWLVNPKPSDTPAGPHPGAAGLTGYAFLVGCLSEQPAYSLEPIRKAVADYYMELIISKCILYLDLGIPNFHSQFGIVFYDCIRSEHWTRIEKEAPDGNVSTIVAQAYPGRMSPFRVLLTDFNRNLSPIVVCFLQIVLALIKLYRATEGNLFMLSLTVDDVVVVETSDVPLINYGELGVIDTQEIVALIRDYRKFGGEVMIGRSSYPVRFSESVNENLPRGEGIIGEFVQSILSSQTNPDLLTGEAADFYARLNNFFAHTFYAEIDDLFVHLEEEFSPQNIVENVWRPTSGVVTAKSRIIGPRITFARPEEWYASRIPSAAPIRLAYIDSTEEIIINLALRGLNAMAQHYYAEIRAGARKARSNPQATDQRRRGLTIAIIALDNFASLIRLLTYLSPDSPSLDNLTAVLNNNWDALQSHLRPEVVKEVDDSLFPV